MNTLILYKKLLPILVGFIFIAGPAQEGIEAPIEKLEFIEEIVLQPNRAETVFKRKVVPKWKSKPQDSLNSLKLDQFDFGSAISKGLPLYRLYCSIIVYD